MVLRQDTGRQVTVDITIFDQAGNILAEIFGLQCQHVAGTGSATRTAEGMFVYHWRLAPRPGEGTPEVPAEKRATVSQVIEDVLPHLAQWQDHLQRREHYERIGPSLEHLCAGYVARAFLALDCRPCDRASALDRRAGGWFGITPPQRPLFARLLSLAEDRGVLRSAGGLWEVVGSAGPPELDALWVSLVRQHPGYLAELTLLSSAEKHWPNCCVGRRPPPAHRDSWSAYAEHLFDRCAFVPHL